MRQVFLILLALAVTVMCQSYTQNDWQVEVIIPAAATVDRVDIFIEQTTGTIQMYKDMPFASLMALNPITVSVQTGTLDSVFAVHSLPNSGSFACAGALLYYQGALLENYGLGVSEIVWIPAEYERIFPTVILRKLP